MGAENRASPRYAVEAAIEVRSDAAVTHGRTTNVSRGGLSALVDRALERGSLVRVRITLVFSADSFSEPLELPARVVWATSLGAGQHQLGVSFAQLRADEHKYLDMFLRFLEQASSSPDDDEDEGDDDDREDDPFAS